MLHKFFIAVMSVTTRCLQILGIYSAICRTYQICKKFDSALFKIFLGSLAIMIDRIKVNPLKDTRHFKEHDLNY